MRNVDHCVFVWTSVPDPEPPAPDQELMFLGLPDPDPLVPSIIKQKYDFLSLKNDVNIPSKSKKQKYLLYRRLEGY
jgi:hypothetical protein